MPKPKLSQPISLRITEAESELLSKLMEKGVKQIDCFRRGLRAYEADCVEDLTQGNVS